MNYADEAVHSAITETRTLRERLKKKNTAQVRGAEKNIVRATALAWCNNHRKKLVTIFSDSELSSIDKLYQTFLLAAHKDSTRSKLLTILKDIGDLLVEFRVANMVKLSAASDEAPASASEDVPPDFSPLVKDDQMKELLEKRWLECNRCVEIGAPLATIVMAGGFLEGLLLGRILSEKSKAAKDAVFAAKAAPKDDAGKTKELKEWTLQNFIDVAHELKWITVTTKDVGDLLRDYRNFIHPYKELSQQISLAASDASLIWIIGKTIARQVIASVSGVK